MQQFASQKTARIAGFTSEPKSNVDEIKKSPRKPLVYITKSKF